MSPKAKSCYWTHMCGSVCCKCNQLIDILQLKWLCLLHPQFSSKIAIVNVFMLEIYKVKVFVRLDLAIYGLYMGPFLGPCTWNWLFWLRGHFIPERMRSLSFSCSLLMQSWFFLCRWCLLCKRQVSLSLWSVS